MDEASPIHDAVTMPLMQTPVISLVKTGTWNDGNSDGSADAGETVSYTLVATNDGSMAQSNVFISDTRLS